MSAPRRAVGRGSALTATGVLAVGIIGAVVGVLLAVHVRYTCGSDIDRLVQLVCNHATHPYRTIGLVLAVVCALLGAASALTLAVLHRRDTEPI